MDFMTAEQRSRCMSKIRSGNTGPEFVVRRLVHRMGFRYRLHVEYLPGKPDLVFPRHRKVIFVNGCFWHRHNCKSGQSLPERNRSFWVNKLNNNLERDKLNYSDLERNGWTVLVVWGCETKNLSFLSQKLTSFLSEDLT
ncbi:MAG: very short patch repair endonuclease [bacterium]|nr:very short patch repair endonuclease [bacterium]